MPTPAIISKNEPMDTSANPPIGRVRSTTHGLFLNLLSVICPPRILTNESTKGKLSKAVEQAGPTPQSQRKKKSDGEVITQL